MWLPHCCIFSKCQAAGVWIPKTESEDNLRMIKSLLWDYFTPRSKLEAVCNICVKVYGNKLVSISTFTWTT